MHDIVDPVPHQPLTRLGSQLVVYTAIMSMFLGFSRCDARVHRDTYRELAEFAKVDHRWMWGLHSMIFPEEIWLLLPWILDVSLNGIVDSAR